MRPVNGDRLISLAGWHSRLRGSKLRRLLAPPFRKVTSAMEKGADDYAVLVDPIQHSVVVQEQLTEGRLADLRYHSASFRERGEARSRIEGTAEHADRSFG